MILHTKSRLHSLHNYLFFHLNYSDTLNVKGSLQKYNDYYKCTGTQTD